MHELSIAHGLAEVAGAAARQAGVRQVVALRLAIGELAGIEPGALRFCWDLAAYGTILQGSRLDIDTLPVVIHCPVCAADVELPDVRRFRCPCCQTPSGDLRQGRELEIRSLEVVEAEVESDAEGGAA